MTKTLYDTIHDVPENERPAAKEADRLAAKATLAMRLDPAALHAASQAMEVHQRRTGWRYLPSGHYRHRTRKDTTP
ncbi:hypothetical protein [Kocuria tytonis]|uniref:Uncharacterized protein n=1 Tax=Kocuria tytonis TaxID=2054280 RepID=A0A495A9Y9_9MICC|nr:hypothetical protein [Kocuria tytonis]RKQ36224.1 hypothetical protein C1C97_000615 [Kocuria tytonis]